MRPAGNCSPVIARHSSRDGTTVCLFFPGSAGMGSGPHSSESLAVLYHRHTGNGFTFAVSAPQNQLHPHLMAPEQEVSESSLF